MSYFAWLLLGLVVVLVVVWRRAAANARLGASINSMFTIRFEPWLIFYFFFFLDTKSFIQSIVDAGNIFTAFRSNFFDLFAPMVVIYRARQVEPLLRSRNVNKSVEYEVLKPLFGQGLIISNGDYWRNHRRILTPTFHYDILHNYVGVFAIWRRQGAILVRKMEALGPVVDVWRLFNAATLDGICEAIIGRHFDAQGAGSDYARAIFRVLYLLQERMMKPWLWNDKIFGLTADGRDLKRQLGIVHGFSTKMVREKLEARKREGKEVEGNGVEGNGVEWKAEEGKGGAGKGVEEKKGEGKMAFLDLLAGLHEEGALTESEMSEQLNNFLFAGHDTTSMGLTWTMFMLGHNQEAQRRCQAEIDAFITSPADFNIDNLKNLEYLERCFKESIRLYPPVPFMARHITEPLEIDGDIIPVGSTIGFITYAIHRDPEWWADPEKFDPDRFLPHNTANRHPFAYIPFSAGSRNCIGQRFALLEAKTFLAMILQRFDVESVDERHDLLPLVELSLRPEGPVYLRLTPRASPYIG